MSLPCYYLASLEELEAHPQPFADAGIGHVVIRVSSEGFFRTQPPDYWPKLIARCKVAAPGCEVTVSSWCFSNVSPSLSIWGATDTQWATYVDNLHAFRDAAGGVGWGLDAEFETYVPTTGLRGWLAQPAQMATRGKQAALALVGIPALVYAPMRRIMTTDIRAGKADRAEGFFQFFRQFRPLPKLSVLYEDSYAWSEKQAPFLAAFVTEQALHWKTLHGPLPVPYVNDPKHPQGSSIPNPRLAKMNRNTSGPVPRLIPGIELTSAHLADPGWLRSAIAARRAVKAPAVWVYPSTERQLENPQVCATLKGLLA